VQLSTLRTVHYALVGDPCEESRAPNSHLKDLN